MDYYYLIQFIRNNKKHQNYYICIEYNYNHSVVNRLTGKPCRTNFLISLVYKNSLCFSQTPMDKLSLTVNLITMADYERLHYDKEQLAKTGKCSLCASLMYHFWITSSKHVIVLISCYFSLTKIYSFLYSNIMLRSIQIST